MNREPTQFGSKIFSWCQDKIGPGVLLGVEQGRLKKDLFFDTEHVHLFDKNQDRIGIVGFRENKNPFNFFHLSTWRRSYSISDETLIEAIGRLSIEDHVEVAYAVRLHCENMALYDFGAIGFYTAYVYQF